MGSLYKQPASRIWWVKYYVHGRPVRESTGTADENEAKRILRVREGQTAGGQPILPRADRIRYDEAAADLRAHYQATGSRDLKTRSVFDRYHSVSPADLQEAARRHGHSVGHSRAGTREGSTLSSYNKYSENRIGVVVEPGYHTGLSSRRAK